MEHAESIPIPLAAWGAGLANKTIRGDVCPGGRVRMERLAPMMKEAPSLARNVTAFATPIGLPGHPRGCSFSSVFRLNDDTT